MATYDYSKIAKEVRREVESAINQEVSEIDLARIFKQLLDDYQIDLGEIDIKSTEFANVLSKVIQQTFKTAVKQVPKIQIDLSNYITLNKSDMFKTISGMYKEILDLGDEYGAALEEKNEELAKDLKQQLLDIQQEFVKAVTVGNKKFSFREDIKRLKDEKPKLVKVLNNIFSEYDSYFYSDEPYHNKFQGIKTQVLNQLKDLSKEAPKAAQQSAKQVSKEINKMTGQIEGSMNEAASDLEKAGKEVGKQTTESIAEGITENKDVVVKVVEDVVETASEAAAEVQDSHSASKVAEKLGEYWGEGYSKGIKKYKNDVEKSVRDLITNGMLTTEDLQKDLDTLLSGGFGKNYKALTEPLQNILKNHATTENISQPIIENVEKAVQETAKPAENLGETISESVQKGVEAQDAELSKALINNIDQAKQDIVKPAKEVGKVIKEAVVQGAAIDEDDIDAILGKKDIAGQLGYEVKENNETEKIVENFEEIRQESDKTEASMSKVMEIWKEFGTPSDALDASAFSRVREILDYLGGKFAEMNDKADDFSEHKLNAEFYRELIKELDLAEDQLTVVKGLIEDINTLAPGGRFANLYSPVNASKFINEELNKIKGIIDGDYQITDDDIRSAKVVLESVQASVEKTSQTEVQMGEQGEVATEQIAEGLKEVQEESEKTQQQLTEQIEKANAALEEQKQQIAELEGQNESLRSSLQAQGDELQHAYEEQGSLQMNLDSAESTSKMLEDDLNKQKQITAELEAQNEEHKKQIDAMHEEMEEDQRFYTAVDEELGKEKERAEALEASVENEKKLRQEAEANAKFYQEMSHIAASAQVEAEEKERQTSEANIELEKELKLQKEINDQLKEQTPIVKVYDTLNENISQLVERFKELRDTLDKTVDQLKEMYDIYIKLGGVDIQADRLGALNKVSDAQLDRLVAAIQSIQATQKKTDTQDIDMSGFKELAQSSSDNKNIPVIDQVKSGLEDVKEEAKETQKGIHYVTDELGNVLTFYRGLRNSMGQGLVSDRFNGATFWTDSFDLAKEYSEWTKIESANLEMIRPLEIEGNGANWNNIEYLGTGMDEASKKIIAAKETMEKAIGDLKKYAVKAGYDIQDLTTNWGMDELRRYFKEEWFSKADRYPSGILQSHTEVLDTVEKAWAEYKQISDDMSNVYGRHNTKQFVAMAQQSGQYDGVIFKNIVDSASGIVKDATNVVVQFNEEKIHFIETLKASDKLNERDVVALTQNYYGIISKLQEAQKNLETKGQGGIWSSSIEDATKKDIESLSRLKSQYEQILPILSTYENTLLEIKETQMVDVKDDKVVANFKKRLSHDLYKLMESDVSIEDIGKKFGMHPSRYKDDLELIKNTFVNIAGKPFEGEALGTIKDLVDDLYNRVFKEGLIGRQIELDKFDQAAIFGKAIYTRYAALETSRNQNELSKEQPKAEAELTDKVAEEVELQKKKTDELEKQTDELKEQAENTPPAPPSNNNPPAPKPSNNPPTPKPNNNPPTPPNNNPPKPPRNNNNPPGGGNNNPPGGGGGKGKNPANTRAIDEAIRYYEKLMKTESRFQELVTRVDFGQEISASAKAQLRTYKNIREEEQNILARIQKRSQALNTVIHQYETIKLQERQNAELRMRDEYTNEIKTREAALTAKLDSGKYSSQTTDKVAGMFADWKLVQDAWPDPNDVKHLQLCVEQLKQMDETLEKAGNETKLRKLLLDVTSTINDNSKMSGEMRHDFDNLGDSIRQALDTGATQDQVQKLQNRFLELKNEMIKTGQAGKSFVGMIFNDISTASARMIAQYLSFQDWVRYFRQAISAVNDLDKALNQLKIVSGEASGTLNSIADSAYKLANSLGMSTTEVVSSITEWRRLGKTIDESMILAEQAARLSTGGLMDISSATTALVSSMQAFEMQADEVNKVVDQYIYLGKQLPVINYIG